MENTMYGRDAVMPTSSGPSSLSQRRRPPQLVVDEMSPVKGTPGGAVQPMAIDSCLTSRAAEANELECAHLLSRQQAQAQQQQFSQQHPSQPGIFSPARGMKPERLQAGPPSSHRRLFRKRNSLRLGAVDMHSTPSLGSSDGESGSSENTVLPFGHSLSVAAPFQLKRTVPEIESSGDSNLYWVVRRRGSKRAVCEDTWSAVPDLDGHLDRQRQEQHQRHHQQRQQPEVMDIEYGSPRRKARPPSGLFAVFDGHGGQQVATAARDDLLQSIAAKSAFSNQDRDSTPAETQRAVVEAFLEFDARVCATNLQDLCGATASSVIFKNGRMFVAWVGDTRAVLGRSDGTALTLSKDHRATREDEIGRIEGLGGFVLMNRVDGVLSVSRAFGDSNLKSYVTAEPEVVDRYLEASDEFVLLASDGLWDFVSDEEAVRHVLAQKSSGAEAVSLESTCQSLVELAVSRGSSDDVTCMLILVNSFRVDVPPPCTHAPAAASVLTEMTVLKQPGISRPGNPVRRRSLGSTFAEALTPLQSSPMAGTRENSLNNSKRFGMASGIPSYDDGEWASLSSMSSFGVTDESAPSTIPKLLNVSWRPGDFSNPSQFR